MKHRISRLADSLRQIGDIHVNDWDFMELLHTDINDLDVTRSLRRLGQIRVTDWDFKDVMPAVNKLAHKEVHLADIFRRTASYRIMEWDFRDLLASGHTEANPPGGPPATPVTSEVIQELTGKLTRFLGYVVKGLIEEPDHARIHAREIEPAVLRFKLVLVRRDESALIGHGGHTASAIRRIMQAVGRNYGVHVLLKVLSHEADAAAGDEV